MLRYDFDMFCLNDCANGIQLAFANNTTGVTHCQSTKVVASFKDPKTIDAVSSAPPIVRLFLEEAGFGAKGIRQEDLVADASVAHDEMRQTLVAQLSAALSNRAMKKALGRAAQESAFNVNAFISAVVSQNADAPDMEVETAQQNIKVSPRRPGQLRSKGIKSRARPHCQTN